MTTPRRNGRSHTEIIAVRHGETLWNAAHRMQGQQDSPLSERGRAQAHALGARFVTEPFDHLYSSDLDRAYQSAAAIAARTGHEIKIDIRLRERAFGIFEGLTSAEMAERHPAEYIKFRERDPDFTLPGGECTRVFFDRAMACFNELGARHAGERVVVVAHGMLLDALYRSACGMDLIRPRDVDLFNASLNVFHFVRPRWEVISWGDCAHLDEITKFQSR
jgi:probable phosphoglycerate mutase